jgi:hypothetical protein
VNISLSQIGDGLAAKGGACGGGKPGTKKETKGVVLARTFEKRSLKGSDASHKILKKISNILRIIDVEAQSPFALKTSSEETDNFLPVQARCAAT